MHSSGFLGVVNVQHEQGQSHDTYHRAVVIDSPGRRTRGQLSSQWNELLGTLTWPGCGRRSFVLTECHPGMEHSAMARIWLH